MEIQIPNTIHTFYDFLLLMSQLNKHKIKAVDNDFALFDDNKHIANVVISSLVALIL